MEVIGGVRSVEEMEAVGVRPMEEDVVAEEVVATAVVCLLEVAAQLVTSPSMAAMGPYPSGASMVCKCAAAT